MTQPITQAQGATFDQLDVTQARDEGRLKIADIDRVHVFLDRQGKWRWRRRSGGNFQTIASPQQGYVDHDFALTMALRCNATPFLLSDAQRARKVWLVEADGGLS